MEKPKYVMATILMPIEVRDLEDDEYVCLQERAHVSLSFCHELPEAAGEGEGYGGLSDKIRDLYDSLETPPESGVSQKGGEKTGGEKTGEVPVKSDSGMESGTSKKEKRMKKNITYRQFRENTKSHRYTFRHLGESMNMHFP